MQGLAATPARGASFSSALPALHADSLVPMGVDTGIIVRPLKSTALPADRSPSGIFRPAAGVQRAVTGVFIPGAAASDDATGERVWYTAIEGRPRGPFSTTEMILLADKGKVRTSSLLWHTGWLAWRPLKEIDDVDVRWLLDIVHARKRRERDAQERASARFGMQPVRLERFTTGAARDQITVAQLPPPVPDDSISQLPVAHVAFEPAPAQPRAGMRIAGAALLGVLFAAVVVAYPLWKAVTTP